MTITHKLGAELKRADALLARGQATEAEQLLLALRGTAPLNPFIGYQLGCVWLAQGRFQEAARIWQQALAAKPGWLHPIVGLANAMQALGKKRDCLRYCEMALSIGPNNPQILLNYAIVLRALHLLPRALAAIDRVLPMAPQSRPAHLIRLDVLVQLRHVREAEQEAEFVLRLNPTETVAIANLASLLRQRAAFDESLQLEQRMLAAALADSRGLAELDLARFTDDPAILAAVARNHFDARTTLQESPAALTPTDGRLTICYLSGDLRNHAVGHMLPDILTGHDRQRFRVLTAGCILDDPGPHGAHLRQLVDHHLSLGEYDDADAVHRLRQTGVDILIDLAGSTTTGRPGILAGRAAATQVMWLGCPVSTGARWYDAWLVDDYVAPPSYDEHASELLIRLPCCYHPLTSGMSFDLVPPLTRRDIGIADDVPLLAALHLPKKMTAEMVDAWFRITASHPTAVLWLAIANPDARMRLRERAKASGLDPQRILFAEHEDNRARYLSRFRLANLVLDSFPYGGHSTIGEALSEGCPVVTRCGRSIPSRTAGSMLHQLGLDALIANDLPQYEAIASTLLGDPQRLTELRACCAEVANRIRTNRNRDLTRALESAYVRLHAQAVERGQASAPATKSE